MKALIIVVFLHFVSNIFAQNLKNDKILKSQNFILENLEGDFIELDQELGEGPVILSFWATWCKPCKEELKEYNKIYNKYVDAGLKLYAISIDNEKSVAKVKPYIKTNGFNFQVLFDSNSEIARLYYAQMVPYSLILDKKGNIVYSHLGYKKGDELKVENIVSELLDL